jgi:hypothetical protein
MVVRVFGFERICKNIWMSDLILTPPLYQILTCAAAKWNVWSEDGRTIESKDHVDEV